MHQLTDKLIVPSLDPIPMARGTPALSPVARYEWEQALRTWDLHPTTKLVALVLTTYSNKDGTNMRPSQRRLALGAGLQVRAVRKHLAILRDELRVIERVHRGSSSGRSNYCDVYRLVVPDDLFERVRVIDVEDDQGEQ